MTRQFHGLLAFLTSAAGVALLTGGASACPVCPVVPHRPTLHEQFARSDAAVLARWISVEAADEDSSGRAEYKVVQVPRGGSTLSRGSTITLPRNHQGKIGSLALLLGNRSAQGIMEWNV